MQERKVREERTPQDFYTGSLKPELHPVCQGNLSLTLHYFKSFTKYPPLHFQNMQKHHKRLLNHIRITPTQQEPSCKPGNHQAHTQSLRKIKPQWQHSLAYHKPLSPSFKPSQKLQELIHDQSSTAATPMITKERVSTSFQNKIVL